MELRECIEFATQYPAASIATVDGDQPRLRVFMLWRADETGFYFQTCSYKEVCEQLVANAKAEICFFNAASDLAEIKTLRVTGQVEVLDDQSLKQQLLDDWPFMVPVHKSADNPEYVLFRIAHGEAHFWSMADAGKGRRDLELLRF